MKVSPVCVPCLLKRVIYESELVSPDKVPAAVRAACSIFSKRYSPGRVSARLATEVHREVYRLLCTNDPYREMKDRSNKVALGLMSAAGRLVARSNDSLRTAIMCSIAGNILDFGIQADVHEPEVLRKRFAGIMEEGLAVDHLPRLRRYLRKGARVLYFADNCGEIVFDGLVFRELRKLGAKVTLVVRGEPILTDATLEDVEALGLRKEVDGVLDTGSFAVGVDFDRIPQVLRRALDGCDVIISKGMANFESFSDTKWRPIAHLMRTKCAPVAEAAGAPFDVSILKLWD